MAQINLTIPDATLPRVVDAIANIFNFALNGLPSETKNQFAKRMLIQTMKQWVKSSEVIAVDTSAHDQKAAISLDIDTNVSIA